MCAKIRIELNRKLYIKDPENTHLGWRIVTESVRLIDELGFENFTFKKLATAIESTEASVYRYFESKHKLLIYLVSWYWVMFDYQMSFKTNNIQDPKEKLRIIISNISCSSANDPYFTHIDQEALHRIVINESSKAYLIKDIDNLEKEGLFVEYKNICSKIGEVILQINPSYQFPLSLVTTIFQTAHQQLYFSKHIPALTSISSDADRVKDLILYLEGMVFSSIGAVNS